MPRFATRHPALPDLVGLAAQMRRDRDRPRPSLWRRDRGVGREVEALKRTPAAQVVAWLEQVAEPADRTLSARIARAQRLVVLVLVLLGAAIGWAAAAAIFYYTGEQPVNVVGVLAVFVGLQSVLLCLFALACLPDRLLRWVPGAEPVVDALRLLSPGRLAPLIVRLLPAGQREGLATALGRGEAHQQVYGLVQKWAVLTWSQAFGVAFNVGALLRYLYLVFFSDLAFVWSTTVQTDASAFHAVTRALAWPWAWAISDAAPTYELVRGTRYFRFDSGAVSGDMVDAAYFGGWWPFLLMCLIVYGLLPRVVTLVFSAWRLRRATRVAVLHTPGVTALLDRLNSEYIQTQSEEAAEAGAGGMSNDVPAQPAALPTAALAVVNWSGVPMSDDDLQAVAGGVDAPVYHAGGARSLDEDRETLQHITGAATSGGGVSGGGVVVVVKSWEPPVLEVMDFLADLRAALGKGAPIAVVPIAPGGARASVDTTHLAQWRRKVSAAGDPWLSVTPVEGGAQA